MRRKLQEIILRLNTGLLTALIVMFVAIMTMALNWGYGVIFYGGMLPLNALMFGLFEAVLFPLIIAPLVIGGLKRTANLESSNQALAHAIAEQQRAQQAAQQRANHLQAINELAIECATASSDADLSKIIAEKLHALTGAIAATFSTYDAEAEALVLRYMSASSSRLAVVSNLLGRNVRGVVTPVPPEQLQYMLTTVTDTYYDLHEVSFGTIPRPVARAIQKALNIGHFTALAIAYQGKLWGAAIIVSSPDQLELDRDVAQAFAHIAAVALQRQSAERALRQREEYLNAIFNNLPLVFFVLDIDGMFTISEGQGLALLGLKPGQVVGQSAFDVYAAYPQVCQVLHQALAGEVSSAIHVVGENVFEVFYTLRHDAAGQPDGLIGLGIDITERQQTQAEREVLIAELQAKTTELEQFTYTVSHDLKSPLVTVKGFLGLLQQDIERGDAARIESDIEYITGATDKMQELLNELLELSRIGRLLNPSEAVPMSELAHEAVASVAGQIAARGVQVEIAPDLPVVRGDRVRLREVLENLIGNAAKCMGDQLHPRIEVDAVNRDGEVVFFVRDNGIGIAPWYHDKIFGLFEKLDSGSEGTGIGLAIVKRIIETHGGRIWVESAGKGHGSTFCFTLPQTG